MKNLIIAALCLAFLALSLTALPIHGEDEIYDSVVRLHVLASSDSDEDQALKLKVRDAILQSSAKLFENVETKEEAEEAIEAALPTIKEVAEEAVREAGYSYEVKIKLGEESYPTKNYESFCFPSGEYLSLQVLIGEGEGKNWWCVLFPPLCLSAATDKSSAEDAFISVGLTEDQYKIITEYDKTTYRVRFKVLEAIETAFGE